MSKIVAITGGIGSGKSIVSNILQRIGYVVYNADEQARTISDNSPEIKENICKIFGKEAYNLEGLNRQYIASIVFKNPAKLLVLNSIIHPAVEKDFQNWVESKASCTILFKESALVFEQSREADFDDIILVYAPEIIRIKRIIERNKLTEEQILMRIKNQISQELLFEKCKYVINNDNLNAVLPQVYHVLNELV